MLSSPQRELLRCQGCNIHLSKAASARMQLSSYAWGWLFTAACSSVSTWTHHLSRNRAALRSHFYLCPPHTSTLTLCCFHTGLSNLLSTLWASSPSSLILCSQHIRLRKSRSDECSLAENNCFIPVQPRLKLCWEYVILCLFYLSLSIWRSHSGAVGHW